MDLRPAIGRQLTWLYLNLHDEPDQGLNTWVRLGCTPKQHMPKVAMVHSLSHSIAQQGMAPAVGQDKVHMFISCAAITAVPKLEQ